MPVSWGTSGRTVRLESAALVAKGRKFETTRVGLGERKIRAIVSAIFPMKCLEL